jgi:RNA recognition motif-containing protein
LVAGEKKGEFIRYQNELKRRRKPCLFMFGIISSTILKDRYNGQLRGFAFVEMPDQTEARAAIKDLSRKFLLGRQMILYGSPEN